MKPKTVIQGDFNLDFEKIYSDNYAHKNLFQNFDKLLSIYNLIQMVNFKTGSRMVGSMLRSSILDHVNVEDPVVIRCLRSTRPYFVDHLMVEFCVNGIEIKCKKLLL